MHGDSCISDRRPNIKKIVILGGSDKGNSMLIECLKILFPECDIQVQPKSNVNAGRAQTSSIHTIENNGGN